MIHFFKEKIRGIVFGRTRLGEIANSFYDTFLFLKFSFFKNPKSKTNRKSFLTKQYHIIEKGLSLPNPRQNFGISKIQTLINKSEKYICEYGLDDFFIPIVGCLREYLSSNPELSNENESVYNEITNFINKYFAENSIKKLGGTKLLLKKDIERLIDINYLEFVKSRVSIRDFSNKEIDSKDIEVAIEIARNTPSVCNRQNWFVHFYDKREIINELLQIQAGGSGFVDSIKALLIITSDLEGFTNLEHNQLYIDGGLFSMNLLLSLHSKAIGACCLNTCLPFTQEVKVKKIGKISKNERLIMFIGIGYLKDNFKVAYSQKKDVSDILVIH